MISASDARRLSLAAAESLERAQVGECQCCSEIEHILEQVINLDGTIVPPKNPNERTV